MDVGDLYRQVADDAVVVAVHVQPASGRTAVVGRHGTALKVKVAAPPEGGRANQACVTLLAETFGADAQHIELVSGVQSRAKRFRLSGLAPEEFRRRLERAISDGGDASPGPRARPPGSSRPFGS